RGAAAMDRDASRIPVVGGTHRPAETQVHVPSKKQCTTKTADPEFSKDPKFNFRSSTPADGVFKAGNQGLPKSAKKVEQFSRKAATRRRYKLEAELRTEIQLLERANQYLRSRLTEAQSTIKKLKEENDSLVQEVENLNKFQETCMVMLESRNIDPVTDSSILEQEKETQEWQKQTTLLIEKVIEELRLFNQRCAKETKELQALMDKWKLAEEERRQFLENHSSFQAEMKEHMATLDKLERLL
ncbi:SKAP protein, partial [Sclerurus mexicanus]|nr:SKAP protein [Sclerurus mexicanus]